MHHLDLSGSSLNPYERAIGIVGDRLSAFDEDNKIPCFGFGDSKESLKSFQTLSSC
jgi:E3 ubiquitin-protein ligase RGLG